MLRAHSSETLKGNTYLGCSNLWLAQSKVYVELHIKSKVIIWQCIAHPATISTPYKIWVPLSVD